MNLYDVWNSTIPGWWLPVAWVISAAGWAMVMLLWIVQVYLAAQGQRWPAMYIHIFKTGAVATVFGFFLLSIFWRDAVIAPTITLGAYSRYPAGGLLFLSLFIEAAWRIKENAALSARSGVVKDVPYLKEVK